MFTSDVYNLKAVHEYRIDIVPLPSYTNSTTFYDSTFNKIQLLLSTTKKKTTTEISWKNVKFKNVEYYI